MQVERIEGRVPKPAIWFTFLGGPVAWVLHFTSSYAIAEFGCAGGLHERQWLGINPACLLILGVTLVMGGVAAAATWTAFRDDRELREPPGDHGETVDPRQAGYGMSRVGVYMSALFLFIVLVETVPAFFFLQGC